MKNTVKTDFLLLYVILFNAVSQNVLIQTVKHRLTAVPQSHPALELE